MGNAILSFSFARVSEVRHIYSVEDILWTTWGRQDVDATTRAHFPEISDFFVIF